MWSATWPKEVKELARDYCREDPVRVQIGSHSVTANTRIEQQVQEISKFKKFDALTELITAFQNNDKILIFCETKKGAD